jgi:Zn-dependent protease with chaperone function
MIAAGLLHSAFICVLFILPSDSFNRQRTPVVYRQEYKLALKMQDRDEKGKDFIVFQDLNSRTFAHPLDKTLSASLSRIPLAEFISRRILRRAETSFQLENLSSAVLVGPEQLDDIYELLVRVCNILDVKDVPELYIKQNPVPNAYTLAFQGRKPFIVMHSSILDLLSSDEVAVVLAHELGHIKCEHSLWITVLNILLFVGGGGGGGGVFTLPLQNVFLSWLRSAELSCDRAALLVSQDASQVISVMMKLSGGSPGLSGRLNADAYLQQAKRYEKASRNSGTGTHPLPVTRATEIERWAQSAEYKGLLRRAAAKGSAVLQATGKLVPGTQ